jgi:hypothetical protein
MHQLFIKFKRETDVVRRELFYNILFEFVMTMKLGELTRVRANEIYKSVRKFKYLTDVSLIGVV